MKSLVLLLTILLSTTALAAGFENLIIDQDLKGNTKKLEGLRKKKGTVLFWWNVAWGKFNENSDLDKNLLALMNSPLSPDIIALGEYKQMILSASTKTALAEVYKYTAFVPYVPGDVVGIGLFSKHPFHESSNFDLDWTPVAASKNDAEAYKKDWMDFDRDWARHWHRSFSYFNVEVPGRETLSLVPVHLASPWLSFHRRFGNWKTFRTIMKADENPLLHQLERMNNVLSDEFGPSLDKSPLVLLGDFNIPSKIRIPILGGKPKMYKLLRGNLREVLDDSDDTFPAKSSLFDQADFFKKNSLQIDHIFHNNKIPGARAEVIQLQGSDHYPLLIVID